MTFLYFLSLPFYVSFRLFPSCIASKWSQKNFRLLPNLTHLNARNSMNCGESSLCPFDPQVCDYLRDLNDPLGVFLSFPAPRASAFATWLVDSWTKPMCHEKQKDEKNGNKFILVLLTTRITICLFECGRCWKETVDKKSQIEL